jgi:hypothetical protein
LRETGSVRPAGGSNSAASVVFSPEASFSSSTAVGLVSPRSISEIIERLTPLRSASASSDMDSSARSWRTRAAICSLILVSLMPPRPLYYNRYFFH